MHDPRVKDSDMLTRAGIDCRVYDYSELTWLDEIYFWHNRRPKRNRPFVAVKIASALDGSFAARTGDERLQITNTRAKQYGHLLRLRYDAIMVGTQTLALDDPTLNVRLPLESQEHQSLRARYRNPMKVVLGSARILNRRPLLKVFAHEPHKTIAVVPENEVDRVAVIEGVKLLALPTDAEDRFDPAVLLEALYRQFSIYSLLLEGGSKVWGTFWRTNLVDKLHIFQSPQLWAHTRKWSNELDNVKNVELTQTRMLPLAGNWMIEGLVK